eukprot:UN00548
MPSKSVPAAAFCKSSVDLQIRSPAFSIYYFHMGPESSTRNYSHIDLQTFAHTSAPILFLPISNIPLNQIRLHVRISIKA